MATPKKLPSGKWRVQVFSHEEGGKKKYKSFTASTKAEAARMAAEYQVNRRDREEHDLITVSDCVDDYIDSRRGVLSPSTIRGYQHDKKYFKDFERAYMRDLTAPDLQYFVSRLSENHSPKTVRNVYGLLMAAIRQVDDRYFRVTLPAKRPVVYNTPSSPDVKLLLERANHDLKIAIVLAAVGTLRRGEICALEYSDVLYDFNAIYVHRDVVQDEKRRWITKDIPKTSKSIRRVILPKEIIKMIGRGNGRIYDHNPDVLTLQFCRLRDKLDIKCRFHDLRHYAASVMHAIGVPDQYIMERGGWSSDRVLKDVYRNTLSDQMKVYTKKTNEFFSKNITRNITRNDDDGAETA